MKVWHNLQKKNGQRIPWCRDKAIQLCLFYMQYNYIYWTNCYVKQLFYLGVGLIKKKKKYFSFYGSQPHHLSGISQIGRNGFFYLRKAITDSLNWHFLLRTAEYLLVDKNVFGCTKNVILVEFRSLSESCKYTINLIFKV